MTSPLLSRPGVLPGLAAVAWCQRVTVDELLGHDRNQHTARARRIAYAVVRELSRLGHESLGELFGRHHSAILRGRQMALTVDRLAVRIALGRVRDASHAGETAGSVNETTERNQMNKSNLSRHEGEVNR